MIFQNMYLQNLNQTHLKNGRSIWPAYGRTDDYWQDGTLILKNSTITNMSHPSLLYWSPTKAEFIISKNVFNNSAGFTINGRGGFSITNNKFISKSNLIGDTSGAECCPWIEIRSGYAIIELNSFLGEGIAIQVKSLYSSDLNKLNIINNFWGTLDKNVINNKILDYTDDQTRGITINFEPFLQAPHLDTP